MPNFKTHAVVGVIAGLGVTIYEHQKLIEEDPNADFDFTQMIINMGAGFVGAILPDKLEPAYNPNHRSNCHSITLAGLNIYGIDMVNDFDRLDPRLKSGLKAFLGGYLSHLVLDFTTPKSLPII